MHYKVATLLLSVWAAGCGGGGYPASGVCKDSSQCAAGLECLSTPVTQMNVVNGQVTSCTTTPSGSDTCTTNCSSDSDCSALKGPSGVSGTWKCFSGCDGGVGVCGLAG
jgi:hypothetical protein